MVIGPGQEQYIQYRLLTQLSKLTWKTFFLFYATRKYRESVFGTKYGMDHYNIIYGKPYGTFGYLFLSHRKPL